MIHQIKAIRSFGIFQNYIQNDQLSNFNRYNLFYGWNGCGKSTLSNLFECIERRQNCSGHTEAEWEVDTANGKITEKNIESAKNNIYVFNKSFVERNVFTPDENVAGINIVYISESQKEDKKSLDDQLEELDKKNTQFDVLYKNLFGDTDSKNKGLIFENDKFLSDAARSIKSKFQTIEVEDKRLINYDKRKFLEFINKNDNAVMSKSNILTAAEVEILRKSIKPQNKDYINLDQTKEDKLDILPKIYERTVNLQHSVVTSSVINHLKENPEIAQWVYEGLQHNIHPEGVKKCEFCGNKLSSDRVKELNDHFSNQFIELKKSLSKGIEWIEKNQIKSDFPHKSQLYDEFQKNYKESVDKYESVALSINTIMSEWVLILQEKLENPFNIPERVIPEISNDLIRKYHQNLNEIFRILHEHNTKYNSLEEIVNKNKKKIEMHYVIEEITKYDYFHSKRQETKKLEELNNKKKEIETLKGKIETLKNKLSNEKMAAGKFNEKISKFLGRNDLNLKPRDEGGYQIIRNGSKSATSRCLSEGEKSAIALVYFVIKLSENENKIEDSIVVFDDPISSFDSNHLFAARSFIKNYCDNAKQLFIFTHNFWFFKLTRDWFKGKTTKINGKIKKHYSFYQMSTNRSDSTRIPEITNAGKDLIVYDSEYHYLFAKLKSYEKIDRMGIDESFNCANIIRRICEASLSFKFPQFRNIRCLINATNIDQVKKDRIYDFLNKYSHLDRIETIDSTIENRADEGGNIVSDIIYMLKKEMPIHYENMCKTISM